jgi:hypothetical protein
VSLDGDQGCQGGSLRDVQETLRGQPGQGRPGKVLPSVDYPAVVRQQAPHGDSDRPGLQDRRRSQEPLRPQVPLRAREDLLSQEHFQEKRKGKPGHGNYSPGNTQVRQEHVLLPPPGIQEYDQGHRPENPDALEDVGIVDTDPECGHANPHPDQEASEEQGIPDGRKAKEAQQSGQVNSLSEGGLSARRKATRRVRRSGRSTSLLTSLLLVLTPLHLVL